MKLKEIGIIESPLSYVRQSIWVSEKRKSFILTDIFKVAEITFDNGIVSTILSENTENPYELKKNYEERFSNELYKEICEIGISGFQFLSKEEYQLFPDVKSGSDSLFDIVNVYGIHSYDLPFKVNENYFQIVGNKLNKLNENDFSIAKTFKYRKDITAIYGSDDFLVYGTNKGVIYLQYFSESKPKKIVILEDVCNIILIENGYIFIGGMGYLSVFKYSEKGIEKIDEMPRTTRSIAKFENYIFLNRGMGGIDVLEFVDDKLTYVDNWYTDFSINIMRLNSENRKIIVSSQSGNKLAFLEF